MLCSISAFAQKRITFKIEKLSTPENFLYLQSYDDIYKKLIMSETEVFSKEVEKQEKNPPFNIIAKSEAPDSLVSYRYHSFFQGMYQAYADHRPFVLSPDMIWLLISQGFARHINANQEAMRDYIVDFSGKQSLIVKTDKQLEDPTLSWNEIFPQFTEQIKKQVGNSLVETLTCNFSTTTPLEKIASEITIMESVKPYFEFIVIRIVCGIPEITLEGTPEDWEKVLSKAKSLKGYKLEWWISELEPLLEEFVKASKGEYLRDEQKQSCFHPAACELRIGSGEDAVPGQVYHLSDGRTVQLVGTVDRADEWVEEDGTRWVRVVDYKTGTKKLNLKEVYCGLDCQMLLYLFSLTRDKSGRFTGAEPAGVLYLLADPAPKTTNRQQAQQDVQYELDGLVRDEQKVFDAMDADETGRYLPFGYRNGVPSPSQKDKRADIAKLNRIQLHLDDLVTQMGQQLYDGQIAAEPLVAGAGRNPCVWCDYSFICCHETGIGERALEAPAKPFEPEEADDGKEGEQA